MKRYDKHIFICENKREADHPRGSCGIKNSSAIREKMKLKIKELGLSAKIRVNSAGCLDACEYGPVMVIYPQQIWYGNITIEDVDEIIVKTILNDEIIEKLKIKDSRFERE